MTLLATAHMKVVQVKSDCLIWIWHAETGTSCVPWTIHDGSHHLWIMLCFWWSADWMISNSRWTISETWYFVADVDVCSCLSSIPSLYIISDFGMPQKRFWRKKQPKNYTNLSDILDIPSFLEIVFEGKLLSSLPWEGNIHLFGMVLDVQRCWIWDPLHEQTLRLMRQQGSFRQARKLDLESGKLSYS